METVDHNRRRHDESAELNNVLPSTSRNTGPQRNSAQPAGPSGRDQPLVTRGRARIVEDNAIVDISTKGQDTEFVDSASQPDSMESEEDVGVNNNANVVLATGKAANHPLEEGECEDETAGASSAKRPRNQHDASLVTRNNAKLKSYVDQKFGTLAKMVELEHELSDKNRELDLLKARGNGGSMVVGDADLDGQSELTIYCNAVEKSKRGSSSSEDAVDTSNELINYQEYEQLESRQEREHPFELRKFTFQPRDEMDDDEHYDDFITEKEMQHARDLEKD